MVHWRLLPSQLAAVPFTDFCQMAEAVQAEQRDQDERDRLNAAYTAWLMGAGGKNSWKEFCEHYRLIKLPKMTPERKQRIIDESYRKAQKIALMDKG